MWIPRQLLDWLSIAKTSMDDSLKQLAVLRAEKDILQRELIAAKVNLDWFRFRVNDLEYQNKSLLQKAYNISLPVPEIARAPELDTSFDPRNFTGFEDVGDEVAVKLGLPTYES